MFKIIIIITALLLLTSLFSGCFEESNTTIDDSSSTKNFSPTGIITAPDSAFFGESIEFDASKSYDSDGEIVSYKWDFGDEITAEGAIVEHKYEFDKNFTIDYPLIYSVNLFVKDDNGSITANGRQIKIYPGEYVFYLYPQKLTLEKPSSDKDKMRGSGLFKLFSPQTLTYDLDNPIIIQKCGWNVTLYLKKPLFSIVNKISLSLYNGENEEIANEEKNLGNSLWLQKEVEIEGSLDKDEIFKTIKIVVYGFSLRKEISILYGGEKLSQILFDFKIT